MELRQQLEKWQGQAADANEGAAADMDVAKRLLKHGIEALDEIDLMREVLKKANEQSEHYEREWHLRGNEIERLRGAIHKTLDENGHLADGDNCTLIHLVRMMEGQPLRAVPLECRVRHQPEE